MKSLFNILTACVNVNTSILAAAANSMKKEGAVVPELIKDIKDGLVNSGLADAVKENISANHEAGIPPTWIAQAKAEVKALKKAAKDLLKEEVDADEAA